MTKPHTAGSLHCTVEDLCRWDQALRTDQLFSSESWDRTFTPGLGESGYGWFVMRTDEVTTIQHGGGINGFNALITGNPESRRTSRLDLSPRWLRRRKYRPKLNTMRTTTSSHD
jgi:hypothetical protein